MAGEAEKAKFIVGLGNPGRSYVKTRHNVGWMVTGELRNRWSLGCGRKAFGGLLYDARELGPQGICRSAMVFEPQMYMNRSGEAVKGLVGYHKAKPEDVLVVLDDMALKLGWVRARPGGSDGGHNGLKDILRLLGTQQVPRLRIGIGPPSASEKDVEHVLSSFSSEELGTVAKAVSKAADAVEDWLGFGISYVMDKYNSKAEQLEHPDNGNEK